MRQGQNPFEALLDADLILCIFPHLRQYLVIDARRDALHTPGFRLIDTGEVFTEDFCREVEKAFSALLRSEEPPFQRFISMPQQVEGVMRQRGLEAMLGKVKEGDPSFGRPQIALLLCTGPVLSVPPGVVLEGMKVLLGSKAGSGVVEGCAAALERLLAEEKGCVEETQTRLYGEVIRGESPFFPPLWESEN